MYSLNALALLAFTGSVLAAPVAQGNVAVVYETVVHTAVVTVEAQAPAPTPAPQPQQPKENIVYVTVKKPANNKPQQPKPTPTPTPVYEAPAPSSVVEEVPEPTEPAPAPAPAPSKEGYMAVVDEWRAKLGLKALIEDATLAANAYKTAKDGNGQMVHQLNPGSMGQVLAPGPEDEFEHCFVGGWLCEIPTLPGLNGVCATQSEGWYYTSTGHADILTSGGYSKIGCGWAGNIWACDLA
ncbi:hypothetical protein BU24DRAFT_422692 [Aaosphaeria arxii CBS 175.79]|uniref:SCP domain-containing protein n=1 Tax=Aaosphaeria arxii CBS 175.79 TaxID=1450172 RepID=A0A6A5XTR3_9PLEO|nr:uncharacterized protein BU24DRAFT_422692 [Aaosphaeria arxii CBS 175.79]KAF2016343.1 hypothetical protein BU24DRAFT_422692 [Aaosphaeria arxii CBS 175.79]